MNPMDDIYIMLCQSLLEIDNQCQDLRKDIAVFVHIASTLPAAIVNIRLSVMSIQITMQASRLLNSHDVEGAIFVMMSDTVLSIQWIEKELLIESKGDYKISGYLTLSLEQIVKMIEHLADGIDSGQPAEAVEWINRYEPSLALEVKKLL